MGTVSQFPLLLAQWSLKSRDKSISGFRLYIYLTLLLRLSTVYLYPLSALREVNRSQNMILGACSCALANKPCTARLGLFFDHRFEVICKIRELYGSHKKGSERTKMIEGVVVMI